MADEPVQNTEQQTPSGETLQTPSDRGSLLSRVQLLGFLAVVIIGECLLAYLLIPGPSQTAAMAAVAPPDNQAIMAVAAAAVESGELPSERSNQLPADGLMEVDLGQFSVTCYQPSTNTNLRIEFHLFGTIRREDQEAFNSAYADSTHRIREQVIVTVRAAEPSDLTDAGLGLIKRRILEKTNRLLGKPLLTSLVVSEFSSIEQ